MRQQGRLDGGEVCVCFAMLGVPLGSASLTGRGVGGHPALHYHPEWCSCAPLVCTRINVSTQRLYSAARKQFVCLGGRVSEWGSQPSCRGEKKAADQWRATII